MRTRPTKLQARWKALCPCALAVVLTGLLVPCLALARRHEVDKRLVVDETGREVRVPVRIERIVSLAPNLTEIVYALGQESRLVAVSDVCDYPPDARRKPKVGSVVTPSIETIIQLRPDVVLGTTAGNRRETVDALERTGIAVYGLDPRTVEGILVSIQHLADLLGVPEKGREVTAGLEAQLDGVAASLTQTAKPEVLFVLWLDPLLSIGPNTFIHDVLVRAGANSITADLHQNWPRLSIEEVIERDPDYLVLPRLPHLQARFDQLKQEAPWGSLRAVTTGHIVWLEDHVIRPGPRIAEAVADLARQLHPEIEFRKEVARP